jgi:nucleotide-binding universal stress UspA family protein
VRRIAAQVQAEGLRASASVGRGDPARGVLEIAARCGVEMIIMATHGRTGLDAAFTGSAESRVVAKFSRPIGLVRSVPSD